MTTPWRRSSACALGVAFALLGGRGAAEAGGSVDRIQEEFRAAIEEVVPATVICLAAGVEREHTGLGSSGVIVTRSGYVLSDGDAGIVVKREGRNVDRSYVEEVEVRIPDLEEGGFRTHRAAVVRRVRSVDTTLLRILDPPTGGFPNHIPPASSDHLQVGDFTFATGNAYGGSREAPPATTAGVVAALSPLPAGDAGGRLEAIYTSAAVNPGVNGGPVVDVEGRLVGTVSTFMTPEPGQPFQFLGRVIPMDRVRASYADLPEAEEVFGARESTRESAREAGALETTFRYAARRAYPSVVSLSVERSAALSTKSPGVRRSRNDPPMFEVPRYQGPFSGILVEADGWVVTSLANLTNVASLVFSGASFPRWSPPPEAQVATGLQAVQKITVHFPDGRDASARVVAHDGRLGVALLKADLDAEGGTPTMAAGPDLAPAPRETFVEGRFVVAVGNPFGPVRSSDPLLTYGVLSKFHGDSILAAWRGQWQTDAAATDANCGGALVDLRGRIVGMLQVWSPLMFGRNSGVAFVVPWGRILEALPALKEGQSTSRGFLGVVWKQGVPTARATIREVVPESAAARAGLRPGDTIVGVDGHETPTLGALVPRLAVRWRGDAVALRIERDGGFLDVEVVLGERPKSP